MPGGLLQVTDGAGDARLVQPRFAVAQVELRARRREPSFDQHLAEIGALGEIRHVLVALNPLPTHRLELLAERALDEIVFPLGFHWRGQMPGGARSGMICRRLRRKMRKSESVVITRERACSSVMRTRQVSASDIGTSA